MHGRYIPFSPQANTTNDDGLEEFPEAGSPFNIGIILFRKTALEFAKVRCLLLVVGEARSRFGSHKSAGHFILRENRMR